MAFGFDSNRPRSLRGQLIRLVAALAFPLIALQVWWGYRESQRVEEAAGVDALAHADATAMSLRQFLTQAEPTMTATSARFGGALVSGRSCDGVMERLLSVFTFLASSTTVDRDGNVMCSSLEFRTGSSVSDSEWFPTVQEDPRFVVGNPVVGGISGTWILPLVAPFLDTEGRMAGAVVGGVALRELDRMLRGDRPDENFLVTIANGEGIVLTRSRDFEEWVGQQDPPWEGPAQTAGPGRMTGRGPDYDGIDRTWAVVELENGWKVAAGLDTDAVLGSARAAATREIGITLLVLLVGMLIAGRSYRRIGSALKELASGIPMTEEGEAVPLPEGTPTEVRVVIERFNRAEAAERVTRERYQSIFDNAVFGLMVSTRDGRVLEVNAALVSMLAYESPAALMEAGAEAFYSSPGTRREHLERIEKILKGGVIRNWEVDWVRADGEPIAVRVNGKIITADGEPAFEVIVQDITDEKRRDAELRQTQKMEAIGRLAGGVAHDFNNLLTVIGGNADFMENDLPLGHPSRTEVDQIMKATERATSLTSQLLAFSRKEPWGVRRVDLNQVLTDMEKMLVRLIGEDVTLETRLATEPRRVLIDRGELEQIIMNLVLNARDAMPRGGRVVIETRAAELDAERDSTTGDGVLLSVSDGGLGMNSETRKRAFEPFYTTKPTGEGTGLGLSTVYGIVQRAEGFIDVESESGQGTTVEIWFPHALGQSEAGQHAEVSPEGPASPAVGNERVLVVEDEELVRTFVRRVLENAGYEVLTACDGQEALEVLEGLEAPVALVVTDVVMPRMKGPELVERLATIWPETAVLYMSGYIDTREVSAQLADHADAILRKPFSTTELTEQVRFLLDQRSGPSLRLA